MRRVDATGRPRSQQNLPAELIPQFTTVEYELQARAAPPLASRSARAFGGRLSPRARARVRRLARRATPPQAVPSVGPPIILFVIDTCMLDDEVRLSPRAREGRRSVTVAADPAARARSSRSSRIRSCRSARGEIKESKRAFRDSGRPTGPARTPRSELAFPLPKDVEPAARERAGRPHHFWHARLRARGVWAVLARAPSRARISVMTRSGSRADRFQRVCQVFRVSRNQGHLALRRARARGCRRK